MGLVRLSETATDSAGEYRDAKAAGVVANNGDSLSKFRGAGRCGRVGVDDMLVPSGCGDPSCCCLTESASIGSGEEGMFPGTADISHFSASSRLFGNKLSWVMENWTLGGVCGSFAEPKLSDIFVEGCVHVF